MATQHGDTQVLVSIETKDFIKELATKEGRLMKVMIDKAIRHYAKHLEKQKDK